MLNNCNSVQGVENLKQMLRKLKKLSIWRKFYNIHSSCCCCWSSWPRRYYMSAALASQRLAALKTCEVQWSRERGLLGSLPMPQRGHSRTKLTRWGRWVIEKMSTLSKFSFKSSKRSLKDVDQVWVNGQRTSKSYYEFVLGTSHLFQTSFLKLLTPSLRLVKKTKNN